MRLLLLLTLAWCAVPFAAHAQASAPLTLVYSANTVGAVLPCPS